MASSPKKQKTTRKLSGAATYGKNIIENGKKLILSVQEKHSTNLGAKFVSAIAVVLI